MRISHIALASAAAQRLKTLLPSLNGLPGSLQAELFIIYSSLKYLSMELEHASCASLAKVAAADALRRSIDAQVQQQPPQPWSSRFASQAATAFGQPLATEPLADHLVDVAAILELLQTCDLPAVAQDQVMAQLSQYLFDINRIDLNVYR